MLRMFSQAAIALSALLASGAHAEEASVNTVRGPLTISCKAAPGNSEGAYEYRLAGKLIRRLGSECSPDSPMSYANVEQVLTSATSTTLLILTGHTAHLNAVRVLHIPASGPALVLDTLAGDGTALVQRTADSISFIAPAGGFAVSDERMSTWTCTVEINFRTGAAKGSLAVPYEQGIPQSVCEKTLERVAI